MTEFEIPNYITIVKLSETTNGDYCYIAYHPELPNIVSQGNTPDEARKNLTEATQMAIEHLLSNNLPIPQQEAFQGGVW